MKKQHYEARWPGPTLASLANITIVTTSSHNALRSARSQARKFGLPNTPFTLHLGSRLIHQGL